MVQANRADTEDDLKVGIRVRVRKAATRGEAQGIRWCAGLCV